MHASWTFSKKFEGLTADSPCTAGEDPCVNGNFAQCVNGKFALTPCAQPLQCFALPLVNKAGTVRIWLEFLLRYPHPHAF